MKKSVSENLSAVRRRLSILLAGRTAGGIIFFTTLVAVLAAIWIFVGRPIAVEDAPAIESRMSEFAEPEREAAKKARDEYFLRMLRNPETKTIPTDIRRRELAHAATLPRRSMTAAKNGVMPLFTWHEAGPNDVGGRTRAVAVDRTNPNVIIAGGVASGIWKSIDGGATWVLKTDPSLPTGITYVAQDPTNNDRWFASTGEFGAATTNADRGGRAFYYGAGIYRSTDKGESWELMKLAHNTTQFDSPFDYATKILVSPTTGTVFVASNGFSLLRSEIPFSDLQQVLGRTIFPLWTDFDIASNGTIIAVTSDGFENSTAQEKPGVFYSTNDGKTWQNITPDDFPAAPGRSVIAFAPSDPGIAYLWTFTGVTKSANNAFQEDEEMLFYKFELPAGSNENRTDNLPDFGGQIGQLYTQGGYDMAIAVKPDDPDFIFLGGTNLFRSRDGFATPADDLTDNWIGGYSNLNNITQYANHHSDQHAIVFDPQNSKAVWSGHDGGLSYLADATASAATMPWQDKNNGFNVTQFYHVAIAPGAGDDRILGGTQDNGSPFFRFDVISSTGSSSEDVTFGDGAYAYLGETYAIGSNQEGDLQAFSYDESGDLRFAGAFAPSGAANQLFVNPFAVDRFDESVIYYPGGSVLWRRNSGAPASADWEQLSNFKIDPGYDITALESGVREGASVLYAGASGEGQPVLYRLDDAMTSTSAPTVLSLPGPADAYIHRIAVNPNDGDEILVAMSNYNIVGLYHSDNAGLTFTEVEGNLEGSAEIPGPSIRSAAILPLGTSLAYLAGTSTGLYSTESLNGSATIWTLEADQILGNAIVESVAARMSDSRVAIATHGRGVFIGRPAGAVPNEEEIEVQPMSFALEQNYPNPFNPSTTLSFSLGEASRVTLAVYDVAGRRVRTLLNEELTGAGRHSVDFVAEALPSGAYVYRLNAIPISSSEKIYSASKTMVLSK